MPSPPLWYLSYLAALATYVVTVLSVNYWVYSDASARGSSYPSFWSISSVLFWPAGLYYLIRYRHLHERQRPPTRGNRIAQTLALSGFSTTIASAILAPPDPITQVLYWPAFFAVTLPVAYLLVYRRQYERILGLG